MPNQSVASTILSEAGEFVKTHKPPTPAIVVIGHASDWRELLDWYSPALKDNPIG
jgi:siroheme synthase